MLHDSEFKDMSCESCGSNFNLVEDPDAKTIVSQLQTIDHFTLLNEVGTGAYGTVYKATDTKLDRTVAVKIPRKHNMTAEDQEQFLREARAAAQLAHPNIVSVHEVGRDKDNLYIVSDFIEGNNLADELTLTRYTPRKAVILCVKIAEALDHAHQQGVVHRDLKPSNIMLDPQNEPLVMDFGLAKRDAGEITMTWDGKLLGIPAYMPPEQARGEGHTVDGRADMYSLGVILFELLTGALPFRGTARMLLNQVLHDDPPAPRTLQGSIPKDLETITLKCLEKDPNKRYDSCQHLANDLTAWLQHQPIAARPVGILGKLLRWRKRNPVVANLSGSLVVLLMLCTTLSLTFAIQAARETAIAQQAMISATTAQNKAITAKSLADNLATAEKVQRKNAEAALIRAEIAEKDAMNSEEQARQLATEAITARKQSETLRLLAEEISTLERRRAYQGDIFLAKRDWDAGNMSNLTDRLYRYSQDTHLRGIEWNYLERLAHLELLTLTGHVDRVQSVAFNQSGNRVVSGGAREVVLWDSISGHKLLEMQGHTRAVTAVCFNTDASQIASSSQDGTIRLWNAVTGKLISSLKDRDESINHLQFTSAGRHLVSGSQNGLVKLWDCATETVLRTFKGHAGSVFSIALSPDGKQIASASADKTVKLWDLEAGTLSWTLRGHTEAVYSVAFTLDSQHLISGGNDHVMIVWDSQNGTELRKMTGHSANIVSLSINQESTLVASGSSDETIKIWNIESGSCEQTIKGHHLGVTSVQFSHDGTRLVSGSKDKTLKIWDLQTAHPTISVTPHFQEITSACFSPDGKQIASSSGTGVKLWDTETG
ncbi:MAG: protein kinase, partial [Planctomycetaceae bacterium]|nr:protein kinase [Planctomycetaceae bacterium]